jgi:Bacterial Ig-like domain
MGPIRFQRATPPTYGAADLSQLVGALVTPIARSVLRAILVTVVATVLPTTLQTSATASVPAAPTGLTPSLATITGSPVLQWNRVTGASSYKVDVSNDDSFATGVTSYSTVNRRVVPTAHLKSNANGEIFWRVRAVNSSGSGTYSTTSFFRDALAGPTLLTPAPDAQLTQPSDPPVLSWSPVPGATTYTVQVDTDDSFVSPFTVDNKTTSNTSYLIATTLISQTYSWRVKATLGSGVETGWSEVRTFRPSGLAAPVLVGPEDNAETQLVDVVLEWQPVPGATKYELQIATDENFLNGVTTVGDVKGTRYSPSTTLGNDQYWWRVRPYDAGGLKLDWTQVNVWTFQRHWPDQPSLVYPVDEEVMSDPVFFQWTAVPHASSYTLQMHTAADFEPAEDIKSCTTVHTTLAPAAGSACWPGAAKSYYWRVVAKDSPKEVVTDKIVTQVEHFHFLPPMVDLDTASPADGATVSIPTLGWNPVPNAAKYIVYMTAIDGGAGSLDSDGVVTTGTSFTPRTALTVGKSYRWWVRTVSGSGRQGTGLVPEAQSVFTVEAQPAPTAVTPEPIGPVDGFDVNRFPTLTWTPVVGATYYKLGLRPQNSVQAFTVLTPKFAYPAGEDTGSTYLDLGTWEWVVYAYDAEDVRIATGLATRTFDMQNLTSVSGHQAALSGTSAQSAETSCFDALPEICGSLRSSPVLSWANVSRAGYYKLTLSRDAEMTTVISTTILDQAMYVPTAALADSQAGAAYHWFVQPCTAEGKCAPLGHGLHAFNKRSNPVELLSPTNGLETKVANQVTFQWRKWIETNRSALGADPETTTRPELEAKQYRIQVATDPGFLSVIDTATVDQTTYTAVGSAYPEGPLYWRVSAIDGTGNLLTSSDVWSLDKESPVPTLQTPLNGNHITATEAFRWMPLDYASSYDLEIYKDNETSASFRVASVNVKQIAFTAVQPLAVSSKPYLWRVRGVNASGFKTDWSTWGNFYIDGNAPSLIAPIASARVRATDGYFSWNAVPGATAYKFERRFVGSTSTAEWVKTVALAWAPLARVADGTQEWHVVAYDAKGQVIGTSEWRRFVVDETRPTVTSKSPTTYAGLSANFKAKFSERVTKVSSTTVKLYLKGRTTPLPAVVTLSTDRVTATLNPSRNLVAGRYYTVKLTSGVTDMLGNPLVATSWTVKAR